MRHILAFLILPIVAATNSSSSSSEDAGSSSSSMAAAGVNATGDAGSSSSSTVAADAGSSSSSTAAANTTNTEKKTSPTTKTNTTETKGSPTNPTTQTDKTQEQAPDMVIKNAPAALANVTKTEFELSTLSFGCGTMCKEDAAGGANTTTEGNTTRRQLGAHIKGVSATGCQQIFDAYKLGYETRINAADYTGKDKDFYLSMMMATCKADADMVTLSSITTYKGGAKENLKAPLSQNLSEDDMEELRTFLKTVGADVTKFTVSAQPLAADSELVKELQKAAATGKATAAYYPGADCKTGATVFGTDVNMGTKIEQDGVEPCLQVDECVSGSYAKVRVAKCADLATATPAIAIPGMCSPSGYGGNVFVDCSGNSFDKLAAGNTKLASATEAAVTKAVAAGTTGSTTTSGAFSSSLGVLAIMVMAFVNM